MLHNMTSTSLLTGTQCHTHPKVKDGPKRRRETQAGRVRAVSSASATSSPYPIKQETSHDTSHRHSTPTPITGSHTLQSFASASVPLPTSTASSTPHLHTTTYPSSNAYPTPTSATPSLQAIRTPTQACFPEYQEHYPARHEPVVGLFTTPLQSLSRFGHPAYLPDLAHQVSEPELVGIRTTTASLNSIASMI